MGDLSTANFKELLRAAYDADATRRTDNEDKRQSWKLSARQRFAELAKAEHKQTLLEIGAGAGVDSSYFQTQGFDVLATDLSPKMIEACKQRGVNAQVLDLYDITSLHKQFDAIYSLNVLLHIPKKDLKKVLAGIHDALAPNGIFFYGVYGGVEKEETFTDPSKMNLPRFFSFLDDQTLVDFASSQFTIIEADNVALEDDGSELHFQSLILRKK